MLGMKMNIVKSKKDEMKDVPLDSELSELSSAVEAEEDAAKQELLPGRFSATAINTLTKTLQKFFSALGIEDFATLENVTEDAMTPDIVSAIMAAVEMLQSAVSAEILDEDMSISAEDINDDRALAMLAGRLQRVVKNRKLLKELKTLMDTPEEPKPEPMMEEETEEPVDSEQLFMDRM